MLQRLISWFWVFPGIPVCQRLLFDSELIFFHQKISSREDGDLVEKISVLRSDVSPDVSDYGKGALYLIAQFDFAAHHKVALKREPFLVRHAGARQCRQFFDLFRAANNGECLLGTLAVHGIGFLQGREDKG
jgi:hypothetical protein